MALRILKGRHWPEGVAIPELAYEGQLGRDYVSVESLVDGIGLDVIRRDNVQTAVDRLLDFVVALGKQPPRSDSTLVSLAKVTAESAETVAAHLVDSRSETCV